MLSTLIDYKANATRENDSDNIEFVLNVGSDNYMELQYYVLLLNSLYEFNSNTKFKIKTTITSNISNSTKGYKKNRGEDWGRINTFLSCFSDTFFKDRNIFDENKYGKLQLQSSKSINFWRIIPLIPVNLETI